uniref:Uncharacterized protein n=1 Tax=Panagrolaimus sp. JU765 TaxID=591449 RepID=A0AC34RF96_9BILA
MDLLKSSIENENEHFLHQTNSSSAFSSINLLNVRHPSTMKHDSFPGTSTDSDMIDDPIMHDSNKGLTTTILFSPLHIDSNHGNNHGLRPKSPTLQVQCDSDVPHDPSERSIFCR